MAPKRVSPVDDPPSASSSSEEEEASFEEKEESSSEEEEGNDQPAKPPLPPPTLAAKEKPTARKPPLAATTTKPQPKASLSDSAAESDSESDSEDGQSSGDADSTAKPKPPPAATTAKPQPKASVWDSSESHSGSDSEDERARGSTDPTAKPIASKPMEETLKAKKPKSQPSARKRRSEDNRPASDLKRAKKQGKEAAGDDEMPAAADDGKKAGDESRKLFQRLWSEDDEIVILKGMCEYVGKNGTFSLKDINAFHDFIKKSIHVDVSNEQLSGKIRTLKKKYLKKAGKSKSGQLPAFSKPHEKKIFELSKKIWATEGPMDQTKINGKGRKNQMEASRSTVPSLKSKEAGKIDIHQNAVSPLGLSEMIHFMKSLGVSGLNEDTIKRGFDLIEESKKAEVEDWWKELKVAELELFVKRVEVVKGVANLIREAQKSSDN